MIFALSESVTCKNCGTELKRQNLPRLARKGCPKCAGKSFDFHGIPEEAAGRIRAVIQQGG
jgi:predicted  nucleic acid-binding Zn-ribbon protein